jgi:hypothetical protein
VLRDEAEDAAAVLLRRVALAREVAAYILKMRETWTRRAAWSTRQFHSLARNCSVAARSVSRSRAPSYAAGRIGGQPFEPQLIAKWMRGSANCPRRISCSMSSRLTPRRRRRCRRRWKNCPSRVFHTEVIGYSARIACSVNALYAFSQ